MITDQLILVQFVITSAVNLSVYLNLKLRRRRGKPAAVDSKQQTKR